MIRLARPRFDRGDLEAIGRVLDGGALVQGAEVAAFEAALGAVVGCDHVIAVSSGTAALHLALTALDIGAGDEVVTAAFTFPATANVIELAGATPVLVDIDLDTFTLNVDQAARAITSRTRAVMPVHEFGLMAQTASLKSAAREGIAILEDAACALGASEQMEGVPAAAGNAGTMGCFSFHPRKSITTGEGGAITTQSAELAARLCRLRNHGMVNHGGDIDFAEPGFNYRLTELQAALGVRQLAHLDDLLVARRRVAAGYDAALDGISWITRPVEPAGRRHTYQSYVVMLAEDVDRAGVIAALREAGIESVRGAYAVHRLEYYVRRYGYAPGDFPNASAAHDRALALPLHPEVSSDDVATVAGALRRCRP